MKKKVRGGSVAYSIQFWFQAPSLTSITIMKTGVVTVTWIKILGNVHCFLLLRPAFYCFKSAIYCSTKTIEWRHRRRADLYFLNFPAKIECRSVMMVTSLYCLCKSAAIHTGLAWARITAQERIVPQGTCLIQVLF